MDIEKVVGLTGDDLKQICDAYHEIKSNEEIQTLRAKVASAEVLVEFLERLSEISRDLLEVLQGVELEGVILPMRHTLLEARKNNLHEALATYDKLSEFKHDTE